MRTNLLVPAALVLAVALVACSMVETAQEERPDESAAPTALPKLASSFTVSGKILFVKNDSLWSWQNGSVKQLTTGAAYEGPAWSPDGKRIAAIKRADNYSDLVILDENGKPEKQLTRFGPTPRPQDSSWARLPSWSPNGSRIAFSADPGTYRLAIWTTDSSGGGLARANYKALGDGDADSPTWSSDGKSLAFVAFWDAASQIYVANQSTGAVKKLTNHQQGAYDPSWSPDGSKLAYVARSDGRNDVWVMDADGANAVAVTSLGTARTPRWSPDGQYIAFVASQNNESFDLYVVKLSANAGAVSVSSEPKQLTKGQSVDAIGGISWAR